MFAKPVPVREPAAQERFAQALTALELPPQDLSGSNRSARDIPWQAARQPLIHVRTQNYYSGNPPAGWSDRRR